jgi:hypothetical protein
LHEHPCQKHPSTNTATFRSGHAKSGRPTIGQCLRYPRRPALQSKIKNRSIRGIVLNKHADEQARQRGSCPDWRNTCREFLQSLVGAQRPKGCDPMKPLPARHVPGNTDAETVYECQDCGKRWLLDELKLDIPDIQQRVAPGEPMPAGECPDCGALCHEVTPLRLPGSTVDPAGPARRQGSGVPVADLGSLRSAI